MKPYVVVFAGGPGSSKSIIAQCVSTRFNLPIFASDVIRSEVKEDFLVDNINIPHALQAFEKRYQVRFEELLSYKRPSILDRSVDRSWPKTKATLQQAGYKYCVISMDLSKDFMERLYVATGRPKAAIQLPDYLKQHNDFKK